MTCLPFAANRILPMESRVWHAPACPDCGCVQYEQVQLMSNPFMAYDYLTNPLGGERITIRCRVCGRWWKYYRFNYHTHTLDMSNDPRLLEMDL